jgi:predicted transcriptional regulator
MNNIDISPDDNLLALTSRIVAAYVSHNALSATDLVTLISSTHSALNGLGRPAPEPVLPLTPAVPIRKSVMPDYIISLEDGRQYKTLKRHLAGQGMSPQQYREKWSLPADYPMVAANYAARRSELAKSLGLGRKPKVQEAVLAAPLEPKPKRKKLGLKF